MQRRIIGFIISVSLLASGAVALVPDQVDIASSREWVVANDVDTATISVQVENTSIPLSGLQVEFFTDPAYGQMSPAGGVTDVNGTASSTFKAATKSGTAPITVCIHYEDNGSSYRAERTFSQHVDHDTPCNILYLNYPSEVTVGDTGTIAVGLTDRYGNPIDNRHAIENVSFTAASPSGNAGFDNASFIACPVNESGFATATLSAGTVPEENIVYMKLPSPLPDRYITIYSISDGIPFSIRHFVYPDADPVPHLLADGESKFYLTYLLYDQYGNPTANRALRIRSSDGEEKVLTTSALGQVIVSYGPKTQDSFGVVTMTATALDNSSVFAVQDLDFSDPAPVDMRLSAMPECMPSGDVREGITSSISAMVTAIHGEGVSGETVRFQILDVRTGAFNQTSLPELNDGGYSIVEVETDAGGHAVLQFHPGSFSTDRKAPGFNQTATGTCLVSATWGDITRTVPLTWKNYPYIVAEASCKPETIEVNDTVDVTVRLKGDGWALRNVKPIDLILCLDRGEDMLEDEMFRVTPDRMELARQAAGYFCEYISSAGPRSRVGLVTYGDPTPADSDWPGGVADLYYKYTTDPTYNWIKSVGEDNDGKAEYIQGYLTSNYTGNGKISYGDYAEVWNSLNGSSLYGSLSADIRTSLWNQVPLKDSKGGGKTAPLRKGLHTSIRELQENSRADAVKAVVVLMQNDYRFFGDPLARGDNLAVEPWSKTIAAGTEDYYPFNDGNSENMARFASDNDVRIYVIYYAKNINNDINDARNLAEQTGGELYTATNFYQLLDSFDRISLSMMEEAGVDIEMDLSFENVSINTEEVAGSDAFAYVYHPQNSTRIHSRNVTGGQYVISPYTRDDTANWTAESPSLHFDIGTLNLNQAWETSFRLQALEPGTIDIFGENSLITFSTFIGSETLKLSPLTMTVGPDSDYAPVESGMLDVSGLHCIGHEPVTEFLSVAWNLTYTGTETVTETVSYSIDNGPWVHFDELTGFPGVASTSSSLDVRNLPGGNYSVRVHASAPDAPSDLEEIASRIPVHISKKAYIQIR